MIIALQTLMFFREAIFTAIDRFIRPYFKRLTLQFKDEDFSDDESDDHVFADYDDERGVVFYPPVYVQRYAAVTDCLMDDRWYGKLKKVVDFGYNDMSFIKYLKDVPGVAHILGVDLEIISLRCSSDLLECSKEFIPKKETPLEVTLFQGNAADPDYRLIGTDAVVAIEMIEHMLPHDLERFVHTVFGFIKPRVAVITTPNGDFNVLFKALETNGLRRLDHFFEWSREQFNDWCSNIVLRYPQYTVTSRGIGPGPAGTHHLGCCSQLALFVAKEYQKQPDLNLNSLALLTKQPSPASLANMDGWESPHTIGDNNMLCIENSVESYTELVLKQQSFMTIILTSPSYSLDTMEYKDKMSQCNMDIEFGKNFLMFDDEMYYNILIPRRNRVNRVYTIEDVTNRLNCSTLQVKKFSKATQNLLAKNKMDPYAHTREVVDEIRYLTKILNFNKDSKNKLQNGHIWYNINWGENAPYWNQYYKIVREYSYPVQVKSEDSRIMDAICKEINGIADNEHEKFSVETHTLEIPIDRLMKVVDHITIDEDRVKELLEWNGYDIVGDKLVYSSLELDDISDPQEEWQEIDNVSDWDTTDLRSTTLSVGSPSAPDLYGRYLHRVFDQKLRRIRSITNENVATELDRIVCRLMKLALHTSKGKQSPPPMSWMQQKLFDLLSLTEKAIERRRRHYFENYALKAIEYCKEDDIKETVNVTEDTKDASEDIMAKYHHFISPPDLIGSQEFHDDETLELEFDDSSSVASKDKDENSVVLQDLIPIIINNDLIPNIDIEIYKKFDVDTENMAVLNNQTKLNHSAKLPKKITETNKCYVRSEDVRQKTKNRSKQSITSIKCKNSKYSKKMSSKRSMKNVGKLNKTISVESKGRKKLIGHKKLSDLSKPIPDSLINLFKVDQKTDEIEEFQKIRPNTEIMYDRNNILNNISTTENCLFISIITESGEESIPLRRNIGTDPEVNCDIDVETISETVINITKDESFNCKHSVSAENIQSETIFIYDINEPSTSKGIRNISTDVQCGPDNSLTCALSPVLSLTRTPKLFFNGIKIEDSCHNIPVTKKTRDFGMSTECNSSVAVSKSIGIKIRESNVSLRDKNNFAIAKSQENFASPDGENLALETKLISQMSPKTQDSDSEFYGSVGSLQKSLVASSLKNTSGSQIQCATDNSVPKAFLKKNLSRKLVFGGICVYSLKDKMVSEDVVYQGEWQKAPKCIANKQSSELTKRRKNIIIKKKQVSKTDTQKANENKRFPQRSPAAVRFKRNSMNEEFNNMDQKKKMSHRLQNTIRANKKITRVVSKINIRPHRSNSIKPFGNKKPIQYNTVTKTENVTCKRNINNYLPLYLRRKIKKINNEADNSSKVVTAIDKITKNIIFKTNPEEIAKDLLKVPDDMHNNVDYVIFQSEVETEHNVVKHLTLPPEQANTVIKTSCSPQSQNSSTCSSPNSVATVRAIRMGRHRLSHQKDTLSRESHSGLKSENIFSKYKNSKCIKLNKKTPLVCGNKENIPQSSKNISSNVGKSISKSNKSVSSKSKSLFMAHTNESTKQTSSKNFSKKTPVRSPKPRNIKNNNKKDQKTTDMTNSNIILSDRNSNNFENESFTTSISDANDSVDESKSYDNLSVNNNSDINDESYKVGSDLPKTPKQSVHETTSSIMSVIRKLLEDKLKVTDSNSKDSLISNSEAVVVNIDEPNKSFNSSLSPISIKTVVTNEDIFTSEGEVESSFDTTITTNEKESLLKVPSVKTSAKEIDSASFMSIASTSNSKFSEYYLADNELDNTLLPQSEHPLEESSVQDIFERKDQNKHFNVNGILEAFSGFSVNAEPFVGDNINLIDSETGSVALNSARLTVSEELFVSGRSSDTYESCYFDDDTYVPSWLFSVISQQQSIDTSDTIDEPLEETMFDVNGNVMEPGAGMTSGAGDGKGIHSDNSQDSSGRGTSLSSTASSGPENEAILIDLSAATAYQPLIITSINITEELNSTLTNEVPSGNNGGECARNATQITSDVDADVSSVDTDAIDSDI